MEVQWVYQEQTVFLAIVIQGIKKNYRTRCSALLKTSDENILPGYADHSLLGVSYDTENFLFEIEAYYKNLDNLVEFSRRFQDYADYNNYFFFGEGNNLSLIHI